MHRRFPPDPGTALQRCEEMTRAGHGLRLLQQRLGPGTPLADALRMRRRIKQAGRRPVSFFDRELGVERG